MAQQYSLGYYLRQPYDIVVKCLPNGNWIITIPDLPGCVSKGKTAKEAFDGLEEARKTWLEAAYDGKKRIPLPNEHKITWLGSIIGLLLAVGSLIVASPLLIASAFLYAWVATVVWGWYLVGLFGLPTLSFKIAVGLVIIIRFLVSIPSLGMDDGTFTGKKALAGLSFLFLAPLFVLFMARLALFFV